MYKDKREFFFTKIKNNFGNVDTLNQVQLLLIMNRSTSWFNRVLNANDLHKIPKFKHINYKRTGKPYNTYEFHIFDVVEFMASK